MPKVSTFDPTYGYIRHEEDVDHKCFWCGDPVGTNYDYTPARDIMSNPVLAAEIDVQPYAVTSCLPCKKRMYPYRDRLLTIESKREYMANRKSKSQDVASRLNAIRQSNRKIWQEIVTDPMTGESKLLDISDARLEEMPEVKAEKEKWLRERFATESPNVEEPSPVTKPFDPHSDLAEF